MNKEVRIYINNDLDVVNARMQARQVARQMGFGTADQARISLAASELANVLSWNTGEPGELVLSEVHRDEKAGLQVMCTIDMATIPLNQEEGERSGPANTASPLYGLEQNQNLSSACRLVDESFIEAQNERYTRITLIKFKQ
jgi:serine/threonine-protein kinase RsbT